MTKPFGNPGTALVGALPAGTRVTGLSLVNRSAADRWLLVFYRPTPPAIGDVPDLALLVPAGAQSLYDSRFFGEANDPSARGMLCAAGFAWAWSTTSVQYDGQATAADHPVWGTCAG